MSSLVGYDVSLVVLCVTNIFCGTLRLWFELDTVVGVEGTLEGFEGILDYLSFFSEALST